MVTTATTFATNLTESRKQILIKLQKINSFKGLLGDYEFTITLKFEKITTNTIITVVFPQYYSP